MENEVQGMNVKSISWVAVKSRTAVVGCCELNMPYLDKGNARLKPKLHYKSWREQYIQ